MAYIGNAPPSFFTSVAVDVFSGNASNTAFTLSKPITSTTDIEVVVDNIQQNPFSGSYSVNGTTLTFSSAPASGSNNVVVAYRQATIGSTVASANSVSSGSLQPNLALSGNLSVSSNTVTFGTSFYSVTNGNVGIGTSSPAKKLHVNGDIRLGDGGGTGAIFTDATNGLRFMLPAAGTSNTESMRIDSSGNVGIGTSSYSEKLSLNGNVRFQTNNKTRIEYLNSTAAYSLGTTGGAAIVFEHSSANHEIAFETHWTGNSHAEQMRITKEGNLKFNSGYGSVATAYGCRAWVNFNGTGVVAIRASGNVSSITYNGVGDYTVNFTNAMPDANYAPVASVEETGIIVVTSANQSFQQTASAARIKVCLGTSSTGYDADQVNVAIFR